MSVTGTRLPELELGAPLRALEHVVGAVLPLTPAEVRASAEGRPLALRAAAMPECTDAKALAACMGVSTVTQNRALPSGMRRVAGGFTRTLRSVSGPPQQAAERGARASSFLIAFDAASSGTSYHLNSNRRPWSAREEGTGKVAASAPSSQRLPRGDATSLLAASFSAFVLNAPDMNEARLFAGIVARPHKLAGRSAFADLVGGDRAAFIRAHVASSAARRAQPPSFDDHSVLAAEELLPGHEAERALRVDSLVTAFRYLREVRRGGDTDPAKLAVLRALPALHACALDALTEPWLEDFDSSPLGTMPSDALSAFEAAYGLHGVDRTRSAVLEEPY